MKFERNAMQAQLDELTSSIEQAKSESRNYKDAAVTLKTDYEKQLAELKTQAEQASAEKERLEKTSLAKVQLLEEQIATLTDSLGQMRLTSETSGERLTTAFSDNETLTLKNNELETQIREWKDEKRALMEKCLEQEQELGFERDKFADCRKRFEDAIAAMHELGRENQTLQIDASKYFSRKWMSDSEAINCMCCSKQFTITVRKHHCRHCGLIFCKECTSKSFKMASHKNPSRVCDSCHTELSAR